MTVRGDRLVDVRVDREEDIYNLPQFGPDHPMGASLPSSKLRSAATRSLVDLAAVIISVTTAEPQVLVLEHGGIGRDRLPSGPLARDHRTLEAGLRAWVEQQTRLSLGYVEQLYTFGDRGRLDSATHDYDLSIAYLALVREANAAAQLGAAWRGWYSYFPWEDWRQGRPAILEALSRQLLRWARSEPNPVRQMRQERIELAFGFASATWDGERVLERFELLYEAGLVPEARPEPAGAAGPAAAAGVPMDLDHRRILATAISRLRGKIKYRPIVFELMPRTFTRLELQETVEALSGVRLHKQNFRRLVEAQGLVEETGEVETATGGRPARLVRFRREVLRERPAPGVRLPGAIRTEP